MTVKLLSEQERNNLQGQLIQPDWFFNPVKDCDDNWIISMEEVNASIYPQNEWIKFLPNILWCPPPQPSPPSGTTIN